MRDRDDDIRNDMRDGVKIVATPGVRKSVWLVAAAMALVALAVLLLARVGSEHFATDVASPPTPPPQVVAAPSAPDREPREAREKVAASRHARRIEAPAPTPAPPDQAAARPATGAEPPSREDPIVGVGKPGSGIALFPSRDTKPTKLGIIVPDDFEVPEGYVRHFQAGEDGELLPPILLFHPDYEWVDEAGEVIPLPPDRVVPPELAPPGMPIQLLEAPEPQRDPGDR